LASGGGK
jgi:signal transduction histidine kinase